MDPTRIEAFAEKVVGDLAAAMGSAMTSLGGKLGFYQALAAAPRTPDELATATDTEPRLVRELSGEFLGLSMKLGRARKLTQPEQRRMKLEPQIDPASDVLRCSGQPGQEMEGLLVTLPRST